MKKTSTSSVRIISGAWRGRRIHFPAVPGVRPTHDRIRETLFNWLSMDISQSSCLDLFAGSGALGFEALSRGAKKTVFVDQSREVTQAIQSNLIRFQARGATVINSNVPFSRDLLEGASFDIVFLDPPFGADIFLSTLSWLKKNQLIDCQSTVYFELPLADQCLLVKEGLCVIKQKHTRTICYGLLRVEDQFS